MKNQLQVFRWMSLSLAMSIILFMITLSFFHIREIAIGTSIFLTCLFLICTYVVSKYLLHTLWLKRNGQRVQGVVTEIAYKKENAHTDISYIVEDKVYIHQHGWHNGRWKIGYHQLMIVYNPAQPEDAYLEQYEIPSLILSNAVMATATISSLILTFYCIFKF